MKTLKKIISLGCGILLMVALTACEQEGPMEETGENVDETIEQTQEEMEDTGENMN